MTIGTSISRGCYAIKLFAEMVEGDVRAGGYSKSGAMSDYDLQSAETMLREAADIVAARRRDLIGNAPVEYREAAE